MAAGDALRRLWSRFLLFLRGLATNAIGAAGVVLTTTAFVLFVFVELLRIVGVVTNAYVGLVSYMALPALFVLGLLLIPVGWARYRRATGRPTRELLDARFTPELLQARGTGSRLFTLVAGLTLLNVLFLGAGGARMLHFMDQPVFCGTACHKVMSPEWATYQASPHARVRCVECHVGEGAKALVDAKINGLWQVVSATFDLYARPIPTPVHQLRPARETCEKCHWPDKFYGDRVRTIRRFAFDRDSTPSFTTLSLKIGSGAGERRGEIHWHVAERNAVRYAPANEKRSAMLWVEARQPDGSWRRWTNRRFAGPDGAIALAAARAVDAGPRRWRPFPHRPDSLRVLDCVDCHNRATHIYEDPEDAVDARLADGSLDRAALPYLRREALAALTANYPGQAAAEAGIADALRGAYARPPAGETPPEAAAIDGAIAVLQAIYRRNIHHRMNVSWNAYPSNLGHRAGGGCFRCHDPQLVDERGRSLASDCTLCHSILAYGSDAPFRFLAPPAEGERDRTMHEYLQAEFLRAAGRPPAAAPVAGAGD